MAAADGGELIIDEEAPEFGWGLGVGPDGGDEEVIKGNFEGPVEWETGELGGGVEGGGWSVPGVRVGVVVGTVALVSST